MVINKNVTIQGSGIDKTIIDLEGSGRAFTVNTNKFLLVKNLTIKNGSADICGAILNNGSFNAEYVKFENNRAYDFRLSVILRTLRGALFHWRLQLIHIWNMLLLPIIRLNMAVQSTIKVV